MMKITMLPTINGKRKRADAELAARGVELESEAEVASRIFWRKKSYSTDRFLVKHAMLNGAHLRAY